MIRHPAKYSDVLLPILRSFLLGCESVLDPFAGTGKLRQIEFDGAIFLNEIEPEWALMGPSDTIGDALHLPYAAHSFDAICTSPCYGNRMADHFTDHQDEKHYRRNTYRHALGRPLHPANAGQFQWGEAYREFHRKAWEECRRVLRPGGRMILNISDHIRDGKIVPVAAWHVGVLRELGFLLLGALRVQTPRQRFGQNGRCRVDGEMVYLFVGGISI